MKKRTKIILIVAIIVVLALAIGAYFYLSSQGYVGSLKLTFFGNPGGDIGESTDGNIFDDTQLNPFENETG